jgi:predicted amidohydrolase YtcJ
LFYDDETVNDFVLKAHKDGLQIAMHAIGDRAFDQALNAYENALRIKPRDDHRHTIIHGCLASEKSLKRAAKIGVLISVQPAFIQWPLEPLSYMTSLIGERAMNLNPLNSMLKAGIRISGGSDAPCTVPSPIEGIYGACNHYNKEESISIKEALKMYTISGAHAAFDEKTTGSLELGKYADMII